MKPQKFGDWSVEQVNGPAIILEHTPSGYWGYTNLEPNYTFLRHVAEKSWKNFDMLDFISAWCFAVEQDKGKLPDYVDAEYMAKQIRKAIKEHQDGLLWREWRSTLPEGDGLCFPSDFEAMSEKFSSWRKARSGDGT